MWTSLILLWIGSKRLVIGYYEYEKKASRFTKAMECFDDLTVGHSRLYYDVNRHTSGLVSGSYT
jgi:hypothetical protein